MNILKQEIPICKTVFYGDIDKELEKELILPDYCPDIAKIVRIDATPYIESIKASGDRWEANGTYLISLLYESDYNKALSYATFNAAFNEKLDIKDCKGEADINSKIKIKRIGCKMINPRKLLLRAKSVISVSVKSKEAAQIADTSSLDSNVFIKKQAICWEEKGESKVYEFQFKETYTLSEKAIPIDDVVFNTFTAEKPEYNVLNGNINLKTTVKSKLFYTGENENESYVMTTKVFPVTMMIDDMSTPENSTYDVDAYVTESEISVDVDSYGENRVVENSFNVKVKITEKSVKTSEYATDAFSTGIAGNAEIKKLCTQQKDEYITKTFTSENKFSAEDVVFTELCDYSGRINDCKIKTEESTNLIKGTYTVSVLGKTENGYESHDYTEMFEFAISDDKINSENADIENTIIETAAVLNKDGSIDMRMLHKCDVQTYKTVSFEAVTDIKQAEAKEEKEASIIFCYPCPEDTLWNISKRYYISPEKVATDNPECFDEDGKTICKTPIKIMR